MNHAEVIAYCMTFKNVYQDLPFRDEKQIVICHRGNRKIFAWFYEEKGKWFVRFRCHEERGEQWIAAYEPLEKDKWEGKAKWLRVRLEENGQGEKEEIPVHEQDTPSLAEALKTIAADSYEITKPGKKAKSSSWYFK